MAIKVKVSGGILTILFIALKLIGYISWSWIWILSPIWIIWIIWIIGGFWAFIILLLIYLFRN